MGKELGPVIEGYFASDEHKTGQPKSDSVQPLPWKLDSKTILPDPINFNQWISENAKDGQGVNVFAGLGLALGRLSDNQMQTTVFSNGEFTFGESNGIFQWIYQLVQYNLYISQIHVTTYIKINKQQCNNPIL